MHSVIIEQLENQHRINAKQALVNTFRLFSPHIAIKIYFESIAFSWAFILIYGYLKDFELRTKWAMVSNVHVFKKLSVNAAIKRCFEIADSMP